MMASMQPPDEKLIEESVYPDTTGKIAAARSLTAPTGPLIPFRTFGEMLLARTREQPEKPFLISYGNAGREAEFTYARFEELARRAAQLMRGLGLKQGDRIATLMSNDPRTVMIYFGAWLLGVTVAPINAGEDDDRVSFIINDAEARVVFAMQEQVERLERLRPQIREARFFVQVGGVAASGFLDFEHMLADQLPAEEFSDESGECLIVYTSGTTGAPKGVVLEQANLLADAASIAEWHRFGPEDRALNVLPIHHVNGIVVTLVTPLMSGGSVVLSSRFHAQRFWKTLEVERCTWTSVVPTILAFLCDLRDDIRGLDLARFRHIICGAGPLTVDLARRFAETFGVRVVHGYGLSETTCYSCFLPIDLAPEKFRYWLTECGFPSIGCPISANAMAIHNMEGEELPAESRGEIVVRGLNVMKYYFKRPEANRDAFAHGWFRTGDEGFCRTGEDGREYYFITGRIKELIIRGGINYSPFDIDEVLTAIPGVKAAMAVGFENSYYGEEVGAYVQLETGSELTAADILAACRERLSFEKSPKVVVFGETFPVTSTGKYQRGKLKPLFEEWKSAQFRRDR